MSAIDLALMLSGFCVLNMICRGNPCGCLLAQKGSCARRRGQAPPLQIDTVFADGKFISPTTNNPSHRSEKA